MVPLLISCFFDCPLHLLYSLQAVWTRYSRIRWVPPNEGASKNPINALITYTCVVFLTLDWEKVRTAQMISSEGRKYGALEVAAALAVRTPRYGMR